jgi:hypothetical protein
MSGYAYACSACFGCQQPFFYNPLRVPSVIVNGVREPICQSCVARANPLRIANGLAPIVPLEGAYDPLPEEELPDGSL